jgi:hypothetical protein
MSGAFKFDGCLICEATKNAERKGRALGESELLKAFKAQEEKQRADTKKQKDNLKGHSVNSSVRI